MRITSPVAAVSALVLAAAFAPQAGFAHPAFAPGAEPKLAGPQLSRAVVTHKLGSTVIDYGNLGMSVSPGYTLVDQNTVKCTRACTIVIDANEQVGAGGATGNWFAVCPEVDGVFSAYGCPYAGEVPSDTSYIYARARQTFPVASGTHTVQVYLYLSSAAAYSDGFDIQYAVYTP